ncbi:hypothetical protein [Bradyrhizobium sp. RT9a]|uniref:hypothetical protein n=1 Tax=Bradyrhizobium sp. RT9a TaxID=3156384 RepID=UPI003394CC9B
MSEAKNEPAERPATVDDVVNDALGSSRGVLVGRALDDKGLLAKYGLDDLDPVFAMRDGNEIIREKEPCYECLAEGFYGNGMHGTWYQEGATIVLSTTPNEQLRPLNRAAGINYANWLESLPQNRTYIDIGDMSEAAVILAKDPRVAQMSQAQAQRATIAVAEGLKLKRDPHARDLRAADINRNFAPASGGKSPPMLGAKMSDLSQMGPGMTRGMATVTGPGAGVRKASNPLGGPPPGR